MVKNLMVIGLILLTLSITGLLTYLFLSKLWIPFCDFIGKKIGKALKGKLWLYIIEILMLLGPIVFVYFALISIGDQLLKNIVILSFSYLTYILIILSAFHKIKLINMISDKEGITGWIKYKKIWGTYIAKRFFLFTEQLFSFFILLVALYISLLLLFLLRWEINFYFIMLLILPLYANIWVYLNQRFRLNEYDQIFMRRLIVYLIIIVYTLYDSNLKYQQFLFDSKNYTDFTYLFLYVGVVIYIAIDRFVKEILSDYEKHKKGKNNSIEK